MRKGMTLIEMLIACFCVLFLVDILFFMFFSGNAIWQASITRTADTQELQVADLKIGAELMQSDLNTVTNNTSGSPSGFSFLSAVNSSGYFVTDITGAPVWQKYVIYCIPSGTTNLVRNEVSLSSLFPLGVPVTIPLLSALQVSSYCSSRGTIISSAVTSLALQPDYNTFLSVNLSSGLGVSAGVNIAASTQAVNLALNLQRKNQRGKLDQQSRTITIYMRNSGLLKQ